ncbi:MAG: hypothetical protein ACE5IO_10745, partial [Thermoplasmata archaeon]
RDFPKPHIMETHLKAIRWIPMTVCELESRSVFVSSYSFDEIAHYHYHPVPIEQQHTIHSINPIPFLGLIFSFFLGLFLVLSYVSYRRGYFAPERRHAFQFAFLIVILGTLLSVNYLFASFFASPIVLLVNLFLEVIFIAAVGKLIYGIINVDDESSDEKEARLMDESRLDNE